MKIEHLKAPDINQNGYHKNTLTKGHIGSLFIYPINHTPKDCFSCDGYLLKIADYKELYDVIEKNFNQENDPTDSFRIPDYNISKRFLQPGDKASTKINAGLPNITGFSGNNNANRPDLVRCEGAFYNGPARASLTGGGFGTFTGMWFDASRSNGIYGKSATVQPNSQQVHICIKYR